MYKYTDVFFRIVNALNSRRYKIFGLQGGTSSSKTFSILQIIIFLSENDKTPTLTSVVSETIPHLKRGVIRDFFKIIGSSEQDQNYNVSDRIYTFANGSKIEFFSADDPSKLRGARRDRLYINECNNINKSAYDQLEPRTRSFVFLDWNPEFKFWFHECLQMQEDVFFDISTYKDNKYLENSIKMSIESRRLTNPEWYRVYGEGLIGQYEGRVFKNIVIEDLTSIYRTIDNVCYGLDFGYLDPAAFLVVGIKGNDIYIFKEITGSELSNSQLSKLIKPWCEKRIVWCDSSEPKSIRDLSSLGINAYSVGKKDIDFSISFIKNHKLHIDKDCKVCIKEFEGFVRPKDKNGEYLPTFIDKDNHTIDALRYALKLEIDKNNAVIKSYHVNTI